MATKESLVHSFNGGKVLYVEPNDIYGYTYDDEGHSIPVTPPYQDLCIAFDLVADVYSRTNAGIKKASRTENDEKRKTSYMMSFHSKPKMETQTFLKGTGYGEYDKENGKFEDYYLTTYFSKREFGAYIADKQIVEGLGVESVQISMEHWYTPTIVINFVDVRGTALWGQEEAIHDDNGSVTVENVFGAFFTLPYPVFHLTVKGFFGRPVTYQLSLSSFKGNYDNDGSFKITATFIGYQYSLLTDIPMRYLVAAPYCEYEGKKYWENHVNSEEWRLSDGNPPPKLYEFYEKVKGAVFQAPQNEAGNLPDTDLVSYQKEKGVLNDILSCINDVRNQLAYGGRRTIIDSDDVTHNETIYFLVNPDQAGANEDKGTINTGFNELKDSLVRLNKAVNAYKCNYGTIKGNFDKFHLMVNNLITGDSNSEDGDLNYDGKNLVVYRYFTYDNEHMCISDLNESALSKPSAALNNTVKEWFSKRVGDIGENIFDGNKMIMLQGKKNTDVWKPLKEGFFNEFIKKKTVWGDVYESVYVGFFKFYDAYYYVSQRLKDIDEEIKAYQEGVDKSRKFDILEAIGFRPYIGDFLKVVMCHMETFVHMVKQTEIDAEIDKQNRKLTNASWTDWNDRLLNGSGTVPCWVGVTKSETDLTKTDDKGNHPTEGSVSWLGAFEDVTENGGTTQKFVETRFINSLLKALACTVNTPSEPKETMADMNQLNGYDFFPVLPFDFNTSENIFNKAMVELNGNTNLQTLVGYLGIRLCQVATSLKSVTDYDVIRSIAQLDAYSWYKSCKNGTKLEEFIVNPLKDLEKDGNVADIVYGILSGDPQYRGKYKIENINGTKSYPFEVIKGEDKMFKPWDKNSNFVEASYINKGGVRLTPTKFMPFSKYRNGIFEFDNDGNIKPVFTLLNKKDKLANDWIAPYKMYDPSNVLSYMLYADSYNNDVYNIFDSTNVIDAIKSKYWQLKDKNRLNVTDEYANEMPNYENYLEFMYSNFDRGYEKWYNPLQNYALQYVTCSRYSDYVPLVHDKESFDTRYKVRTAERKKEASVTIDTSEGEFRFDEKGQMMDDDATEKYSYIDNKVDSVSSERELKQKRLRIRAKDATDSSSAENGSMLRNDLVFENPLTDTKQYMQSSNQYEKINYGGVYFPSCPIYNSDGSNHTNIFLHTAYYNTPFKYFSGIDKFKVSNNDLIRLRKLFRCAMFLFTFRYSYMNVMEKSFATSGLKRMPKGMVLQLGAMAWWRRTFDNVSSEEYSKNLNSDFPRYGVRGGYRDRVLFPFVKDADVKSYDWRFTYVAKGTSGENQYISYEETPLYAFTNGDVILENTLCNRFEEFALNDRDNSNNLIFDSVRELLELRIDNFTFDSPVERNYIQGSLLHKENYTLKDRIGRFDEKGNPLEGRFDWNHFTKSYTGIFVDGADLDGFIRYNSPVQDMFRSIYLDEWIMMTTVTNRTDGANAVDVKEAIITPSDAKMYFMEFYNTVKAIAEKTSKNMNVAYLSKMEGIGNSNDNNLEPIKIGMYNYVKNLYDKWLLQVDESAFNVKNFYKTNFYFMTSYYENIYDKLVVNCETVTDLYRNMAYEQSLFNYIDHVISDHNCQLYITPDFIPFGQNLKENKEMLYDVFKPYAYHDLSLNSHYNGVNMASYTNSNRFIAVLKSEMPNTIAPPTYTEYKQDGFTMVTEIAQKNSDGEKVYEGTEEMKNIFPTRNAEVLNDKTNYNELRDNTAWDGAVPCFGVTVSRQNQHLFENVNLNMENPMVTDISARTYEDIVNVGKTGERRVYFHGQDIYKVYSSYSYGCGVTMMGNAQIQPLMYFQLNNIPMWHGAYIIYKVSHNITPGDMKTTFEGQRVSRRRAKLNQNFANGASLMDYSVGDGTENRVEVGRITTNNSVMNKLNHKAEPVPYQSKQTSTVQDGTDKKESKVMDNGNSPFKMKMYHQTDKTYNQSITDTPKYFKVLEDAFNELVQYNAMEGFGDSLRISSLYRDSTSTSDHSNPKKYPGQKDTPIYSKRNCAMDLQITNKNPQRDHKVDLCAPYLLYLLKRGDGRQLLLEIGLPQETNNKQQLIGDDTYLHCFHVSMKDEGLQNHPCPFALMFWQNGNWRAKKLKVEELPPSIAYALYLYLSHCKQKGDLKEFIRMTVQIDFGAKAFDYNTYSDKLYKQSNLKNNLENLKY